VIEKSLRWLVETQSAGEQAKLLGSTSECISLR
jgi:hypothetical protein